MFRINYSNNLYQVPIYCLDHFQRSIFVLDIKHVITLYISRVLKTMILDVYFAINQNGIMSLLRHSILRQSLLRHSILRHSILRQSLLRQSLLRHLLLRQSLLRLLILRQWPIVFAILALLAIQMQYGTAQFNLKGAWFLSRSRKFFRMQHYCF